MPATPTPATEPINVAAAVLDALAGGATFGGLQGFKPKDYEVVYAVGHKLYAQARYRDAAVLFGLLVVRNHLEPRFLGAYASCLQMLGRYKDAAAFHGLANMFNPSDHRPNFQVAECLIASGHTKEGAAMLELVINDCTDPEWAPLRKLAQARKDAVRRQAVMAQGIAS